MTKLDYFDNMLTIERNKCSWNNALNIFQSKSRINRSDRKSKMPEYEYIEKIDTRYAYRFRTRNLYSIEDFVKFKEKIKQNFSGIKIFKNKKYIYLRFKRPGDAANFKFLFIEEEIGKISFTMNYKIISRETSFTITEL